jgi:DNA repair protein RadC
MNENTNTALALATADLDEAGASGCSETGAGGAAAPRIRRLKDLPLDERPRERLLARGADALTDAELIGILFGSGVRGLTAVDLGRDLLAGAGGLRSIERTAPAELAGRRGIGEARAARLLAGIELGRRAAAAPLVRGERISGVEAVVARFGPRLAGLARERFHALLLDRRHRLIRDLFVAEGTSGSVHFEPRDVLLPALQEGAAALIVLHNHPSGDPSPSADDAAVTERLMEAGAVLGVRVLDHVIVAGERFHSFARARGGSLEAARSPPVAGAAEGSLAYDAGAD